MVFNSRGRILVCTGAYKDICGLADDMVAALRRKRADGVWPNTD